MKRMVLGITGSREGMTGLQKTALQHWLTDMVRELGEPVDEVHHGDCIGVDEEAHYLIVENCFTKRIVIHPPITNTLRANCLVLPPTPIQLEVTAPAPYLDRDKAIVQASAVLLAFPKTPTETVRSGTWYTVRYARYRKRPIRIFLPDGTILAEDHDDV